ncbi:StbB [Aliivibrio fischeri]|uniref:StbB family protein n=1 Tax=Aliivibrio fischeri TaxID=668 RepID=UPI0012D8EEC2|nr:StbB family protein [Aliivibrio fischeri]MUK76551.1 StbB [Aliivibrio fischeri]
MKIVVMNFSGNVGKSVIAQHLLKPRIKEAQLISVESINSNGINGETMRGAKFTQIMEFADEHGNVIIDVGASNVEDFMNQMRNNIGSHEDFDFFIVPVTSKAKQISDSISTLDALFELGVDKDRIKIVMNMVDINDVINYEFKDIIQSAKGIADFNPKAVIFENELFNRLNEEEKTINEIVNDESNYRELIQGTDDRAQRRAYSHALATRRLATGVQMALDTVFKELNIT